MASGFDSQDSPPRVGPDDPASRAIVAALSDAIARLRKAHARARRGDPVGTRRLRTSSRRLRSQLQAFRDLIDPDWGTRLIEELRWLGTTLGGPRDLDVLRERFEEGESESERAALRPLFDALDHRRSKARVAVDRTLGSRRFLSLLAELERSADSPPTIKRAAKPCRKALPPLVVGAWKRLRRDAKGLASDSPDPAFHEVRNRAKRARYTTELIAPTLGPKAAWRGARLIRLARSIQDVLGAHQDAVVAAAEVEALLAQSKHDAAFRRAAAGLVGRLRHDADEARDAFLKEYARKLASRKNRGELKGGR